MTSTGGSQDLSGLVIAEAAQWLQSINPVICMCLGKPVRNKVEEYCPAGGTVGAQRVFGYHLHQAGFPLPQLLED